MSIRRLFVDGGVSYHRGLSAPGEPFAPFDQVDVAALSQVALEDYDLVVVPRSADPEVLFSRRYQIRRFLDCGGVLVAFGEQPTSWLPGVQWEPENSDDVVGEPVVVRDHPIVGGLSATDLVWHPPRQSWCCHGHFRAPAGSDVLVTNTGGDAWLYVDEVSSAGVIIASSNLDADTHADHGSTVARDFLARLLSWAESRAEQMRRTRSDRRRRIAGLYSGVFFQHSFYTDPEYADDFAILPAQELAAAPLLRYAALWIPRESNQNALVAARGRLEQYLADGGTIVTFEEANQAWVPFATWHRRSVDVSALDRSRHPLLDGLGDEELRWHGHGVYRPAPEAEILLADPDGGAVLYVDERSAPGRILGGTLDPDCHAGFGSDRTRPLLRRIIEWTLSPAAGRAPAESLTV